LQGGVSGTRGNLPVHSTW